MHRITRTQKAVTAAVAAGIPALTLHSAQAAGATNPTNTGNTTSNNITTNVNNSTTTTTNINNNNNNNNNHSNNHSNNNNSSELAVAEIQAIIGMHDARKRLSDSASIARRSSSMLRESSESVLLSGAESFQLPFEPATATSASASAIAPPSGARGAALMPTQTEVMFGANARVPSWRKQPDVVLQRDLFEACTSVHDVPIPDSVRDVPRPPLFRRGANERVDADDGFWKMR
jgi:hypothetical protein